MVIFDSYVKLLEGIPNKWFLVLPPSSKSHLGFQNQGWASFNPNYRDHPDTTVDFRVKEFLRNSGPRPSWLAAPLFFWASFVVLGEVALNLAISLGRTWNNSSTFNYSIWKNTASMPLSSCRWFCQWVLPNSSQLTIISIMDHSLSMQWSDLILIKWMKYDEIWWNMMKYDEIWWNMMKMEKYGNILQISPNESKDPITTLADPN